MPEQSVDQQIITIPLSDAHIIRAALNTAYHQNQVIDLAEQYRKLAQRPTASKLTQGLQNALTLLLTYIEVGDLEEDDEPEGS